MTQTQLEVILIAAAFTGAAAAWLAAYNLAEPPVRRVLSLGVPLDDLLGDARSWFRGSAHRHRRGDVPLYDGERVRVADRRTEAERAAEYAALRSEAKAVASVSAAPLMDFTQELRRLTESDSQPVVSPQLAALREVITLHEELARIEAEYSARIDRAVARAQVPDLVYA